MSAGERVTWETCPRCGLSAVVGWRDGALVAVGCPGGCRLTAADFTRRGSKGLRFRPPVAPEPTGGGVARVAAGPTPSPLRSDRSLSPRHDARSAPPHGSTTSGGPIWRT
jgi:hypothetical protein